MKILGIETSCDETAICLIEIDERTNEVRILGNTIHSQIDMHVPYGGVFPTVAKREHQENLIPVLQKTLMEAGAFKPKSQLVTKNHTNILQNTSMILERESTLLKAFSNFIPTIEKPEIDAIAVTIGPGLEPALWVGISFARALSSEWNIPVIPTNHMEGHILISLLKKPTTDNLQQTTNNQKPIIHNSQFIIQTPKFPTLALLISGGHTELVLVNKIGDYKIIGETLDDAIGECFDKIARTLGLEYPGGPKVSKLADIARKNGIESPDKLPRPMIHSKNLSFSFSGLKTAVLYLVQKLGKLTDKQIQGICREAEDAITDVIVSKTKSAIEEFGIQSIIVGGGVIANTNIRNALAKLAESQHIEIYLPHIDHATDNALMIALAGFTNKKKASIQTDVLKANGSLRIG